MPRYCGSRRCALLAGAVLLAVGRALSRPAPPRSAWLSIAVLRLVNVSFAVAAMFAGTAGVATGVVQGQPHQHRVLLLVGRRWSEGHCSAAGGWVGSCSIGCSPSTRPTTTSDLR